MLKILISLLLTLSLQTHAKEQTMKTITEIKQHFSDNEIKLCVDIIKGKLDFSVLEEQIKDFYAEEDIGRDKALEQLEDDFEFWGIV